MTYLAQLEQRISEMGLHDQPPKPPEAPFVGFGGASDSHKPTNLRLPDDLRAGLNKLRVMIAPPITKPEVWPVIVEDAVGIASGGWARMALALGWNPLDLFGCSPDGDFEGLAVWLAGRRLVLVDERSAIVAEGDRRSVFNRRGTEGAMFLWDLGARAQGADRDGRKSTTARWRYPLRSPRAAGDGLHPLPDRGHPARGDDRFHQHERMAVCRNVQGREVAHCARCRAEAHAHALDDHGP